MFNYYNNGQRPICFSYLFLIMFITSICSNIIVILKLIDYSSFEVNELLIDYSSSCYVLVIGCVNFLLRRICMYIYVFNLLFYDLNIENIIFDAKINPNLMSQS